MTKKHIFRHILMSLFSLLLSLILCINLMAAETVSAKIAPIILLSSYQKEVNIGDEFYLFAFVSDGREPKFRSSDSKIASVDTYGKVTAKKSGKCNIIVKAYTTEVSCSLKVNKTQISLNKTEIAIEHNETFKLDVQTSNNSVPSFKSSKSSVAIVDDNGVITGCKPGEAVITVKADASSSTCRVTVKQPTVKLDKIYKRLYRGESFKINASVSSGIQPVWKTNKKSVATVDENGKVTAIKHGTALITAKVDGISKTCEVVVESPEIKLSEYSITMKTGSTYTIDAKVSSGNAPVWKSSNTNVAEVDQSGNVYAKKTGSAIISVKEDGACAKCSVKVSDKQ